MVFPHCIRINLPQFTTNATPVLSKAHARFLSCNISRIL